MSVKLKLDIAEKPADLERGLMFVRELPINTGMLFKFQRTQPLSFWGLNTYIPLDIAFVDENYKILKISNIKPFDQKSVCSNLKCKFAIETNQGFFDKNNIKEGFYIKIEENPKIHKDSKIGKNNYVLVSFNEVEK